MNIPKIQIDFEMGDGLRAGLARAQSSMRTAANDIGREADSIGRKFADAGDKAGKGLGDGVAGGAKKAETATERMNDSIRRTATALANAQRTSATATDRMAAGMATVGRSAGAATAAVAGLTAAYAAANAMNTSVANIRNEADRAGLTTKAFQELGYVAGQTRIPLDALIDGFKELGLRGDEFIKTGAGPAKEAFQTLGYDAVTLAKKLKEPEALFLEILDKMQRLNVESRNRISDELFGGTGGERFVELLATGSTKIKQMMKDANDMGLVLDDAMIKKADEAARKFDLLAQVVSTRLKSAVVGATESLSIFWDRLNNGLADQQDNTLQSQIDDNVQAQGDLRDAIAREPAGSPEIKFYQEQLVELQAKHKELTDALGKTADAAAGAAVQLGTIVVSGSGNTGSGPSFRDAERASMQAYSRGESMTARKDMMELAKKGSMLDLIAAYEGTDKGRGYNETLGYGKFTGGDVNLTGMSLNEVLALQKRMLAHPDNHYNSSAVGRYQIVSKTMRGLMGTMGLDGTEMFDADMQDRMARQLLRGRSGQGNAGLRSEWEGFKRAPNSVLETASEAYFQKAPGEDPGVRRARDDATKKAADAQKAYKDGIEESNMALLEQGQALMEATNPLLRLQMEQAKLNELQKAGAIDQQTYLKAMAEADREYVAAKKAENDRLAESASETSKRMKDALESGIGEGIDGLAALLTGGQFDVKKWLQSMAQDFMSISLKSMMQPLIGQLTGLGAELTGGGGGKGILGALKGGAKKGGAAGLVPAGAVGLFAEGTSSAPRGVAIVGEKGPEAVFMSGGEQVVNARNTAAMMSGTANYATSITVNMQSGPGADNDPAAARKQADMITNEIDRRVQMQLRNHDFNRRRSF